DVQPGGRRKRIAELTEAFSVTRLIKNWIAFQKDIELQIVVGRVPDRGFEDPPVSAPISAPQYQGFHFSIPDQAQDSFTDLFAQSCQSGFQPWAAIESEPACVCGISYW